MPGAPYRSVITDVMKGGGGRAIQERYIVTYSSTGPTASCGENGRGCCFNTQTGRP